MTASPASCCSVYLESFIETGSDRVRCGFSTGFLYIGPNASRWLVTNWHVVTGRRPDNPAMLIGTKSVSPSWLRFTVQDPSGSGTQRMDMQLYRDGVPTWLEADQDEGVDLALIRLTERPAFPWPFTLTFAANSEHEIVPGAEVVIIGHPFELGRYAPSAIWKSAMVATDPSPLGAQRPWLLVDAPGMPGMSGSPVYRRTEELSAGGAPGLELFGVYAGASGDNRLETLRLGRVFPIRLIEDIIRHKEPGRNPFPP
jgi:hypothetical protein